MSNKTERHVKCDHEDPIDDTISSQGSLFRLEITLNEKLQQKWDRILTKNITELYHIYLF